MNREPLIDRAMLMLSALIVIGIGMAMFFAADAYHISSQWVLLGWASAGFFAAVGWDYRSRFKSWPFAAFFAGWLILHIFVFVTVLTYFGWLYWVAALFLELFLLYAPAQLFFGLHPPPPKS